MISALQSVQEFAALGRGLGQQVDIIETSMFGQRGAIMSPCGAYRWLIWEVWSLDPLMAMGLLNPSVASHLIDDPTWNRGRKRAALSQVPRYGGVAYWNIFGIRATDPKDMLAASDPVGEHNNTFIDAALTRAATTILGWGAHGTHRGRDEQVKARIRAIGLPVHYLALTKGGQPGHPLYLKESLQPTLWEFD